MKITNKVKAVAMLLALYETWIVAYGIANEKYSFVHSMIAGQVLLAFILIECYIIVKALDLWFNKEA